MIKSSTKINGRCSLFSVLYGSPDHKTRKKYSAYSHDPNLPLLLSLGVSLSEGSAGDINKTDTLTF